MSRIIDFHNHLMPDVDDGAQSIAESCGALTAFAAEGVPTVITTPHVDGTLTRDADALAERLGELDAAWAQLNAHAHEHHPDMNVLRGVELMLDTPQPCLEDERLRLAGGVFVLLEFPFMSVPPRSAAAIADIRNEGVLPIIAHPERYSGLSADLAIADAWRRAGAYLQINGASLIGRYGPDARRFAWSFVERGWADYVGSDYHARGPLNVAQYRHALEEFASPEHAQMLLEVNPARLLAGERPVPLPQVKLKRSLWGRMSEMLRSI
jgi:protein-tyrosine phosphatase